MLTRCGKVLLYDTTALIFEVRALVALARKSEVNPWVGCFIQLIHPVHGTVFEAGFWPSIRSIDRLIKPIA